ncbi:hypothetical protein [Umezawaea sp. Da 62-37]|uniref:hypothetical protein n=1 Tax=Umezawaea sp. Da 62-37 TaxID=3075927 RepID=UPI0028F73948|nr:hypothetical protein [Umezawaea sp. Da 62-37]WNV92205.1 hypothetical protein RM788_05420 [Umezawaea sp. Da 62-37]
MREPARSEPVDVRAAHNRPHVDGRGIERRPPPLPRCAAATAAAKSSGANRNGECDAGSTTTVVARAEAVSISSTKRHCNAGGTTRSLVQTTYAGGIWL